MPSHRPDGGKLAFARPIDHCVLMVVAVTSKYHFPAVFEVVLNAFSPSLMKLDTATVRLPLLKAMPVPALAVFQVVMRRPVPGRCCPAATGGCYRACDPDPVARFAGSQSACGSQTA